MLEHQYTYPTVIWLRPHAAAADGARPRTSELRRGPLSPWLARAASERHARPTHRLDGSR
jgi:hypothetical protein